MAFIDTESIVLALITFCNESTIKNLTKSFEISIKNTLLLTLIPIYSFFIK